MDSLALLHERLGSTVEFGTRALGDPALDDLELLDQKLRTLDSLCRETFQETLRQAYDTIARKLEAGTPLEGAEHKALELLFTGEAKHYLRTENNFDDWIGELQRLVRELETTRGRGLDSIADLMHVQALCRDAMNVLPEVLYYLRETERVRLFEESMQGGIGREEGRLLARMIRDLMASPHR